MSQFTIDDIKVGLKYTDPLKCVVFEIVYLGRKHAIIDAKPYEKMHDPNAETNETTATIEHILHGINNYLTVIS